MADAVRAVADAAGKGRYQKPPSGFGRIYTGYQVTKIPVAFGFQVSPKPST